MKPFPIPVVVMGPGSQPDEEPLQYISSPGEMSVFRPPSPRHAASTAAISGARTVLMRVLSSMERDGFGAQTSSLSLIDLDPDVVREINELLGSGEVSAIVTGCDSAATMRIQESAFAGIWRVQSLREDGVLIRDDIETGAIPQAIHDAMSSVRRSDDAPSTPPVGVMNAPAILHELRDASAAHRAGNSAHVINLTLLPVTPEDLAYLAAELRSGPVTILSRGYGNCRITATGLPHTWWVQYFNSTEQLILNTIEVVDVPAVALAAAEDFADSIDRLREWLATL